MPADGGFRPAWWLPGGHVGFVSGQLPMRPRYWLDQRIAAWLGHPQGQ